MDILRKLFSMPEKPSSVSDAKINDYLNDSKDEFRKPQWFEESETDDELFDDARSKFAFQVFTNPMELQRHFERQMQQIFEALNEEGEVVLDKDPKQKFLQPGYEEGGGGSKLLKEFEDHKKSLIDTDLDGEIFADQLHSLMQRFALPFGKHLTPSADADVGGGIITDNGMIPRGTPSILPPNDGRRYGSFFDQRSINGIGKRKLTDEELIMARIHGTLQFDADGKVALQQKPPLLPPPRPPRMDGMSSMIPRGGSTPFGGVFEGTYQGPKMFSQSVMSKTVRKPDGSYETTKIIQDSAGKKTTTVTRTVNGRSEIVTKHDHDHDGGASKLRDGDGLQMDIGDRRVSFGERNLFVSKERYVMPRNLW